MIIVTATIVLAGAGYWLFNHYQNLKKPHADAIEAITGEVIFFIQSDDIRAAFYKLTSETEYWQEFESDSLFGRFQARFEFLDSLLSANPGFNEVLELHQFTLALNRTPEGGEGFVYLMELPAGEYIGAVEDFVRQASGPQSIVLKKEFDKAVIHTVNLTAAEELFYYSVYRGLFIGSFDESMVMGAVSQLNNKKSLLHLENFQRIHSTAGKNVEANIYIRIPNLLRWASQHAAEQYQPVARMLESFGMWSEIDLLVNNDDLLFNGYTISADTGSSLLDRFRSAPRPIRIQEILPFDIRWMMHWGIDDATAFTMASLDPGTAQAVLAGYGREFGIDIEKEFLSWIGHEIVLASPAGNSVNPPVLVALHSTDVVQATLSLGGMEEKVNRKNKTNPFLLIHNDYNIHKLGLKRVFRDLFGEAFPLMDACYYVSLKDYVLFSNTPEILVQVIDHFYNRKTLLEDANYQALSDNISDRSNVYLYCNLKTPDPSLEKVFSDAAGFSFIKTMKRFEAFALQFSFINSMFYTNMFLSYNPEYREMNRTNMGTTLEAPASGRPFLVTNHRNEKTNILVFDERNTLYLIDHLGRVQWKLPLVELPLGEVFMVDYYGNKKYQYLFNTRNYVYLVDLNGNDVADYPVKLSPPATNGLAVFDYDNNEDYRLLIAKEDNKIYNSTLEFSSVEGWSAIQAAGTVSRPVQYLDKGGKDYLFVSDATGNVTIADRRGRSRIGVKGKVNQAANSVFYINRTNSKGLFLTSDNRGKIIYIDEKGKLSETDFGDFSPGHYFFYEDFNADDHQDFIYVDGNRMVVYDRFKKVILEHQFAEVVTRAPSVFAWAGRLYIGVLLEAAGEIHIFDHQGRRFQEQYLEGSLPFTVGSLEPGHLNLITAKGKELLNYRLN